jgi:hypothetical protein
VFEGRDKREALVRPHFFPLVAAHENNVVWWTIGPRDEIDSRHFGQKYIWRFRSAKRRFGALLIGFSHPNMVSVN